MDISTATSSASQAAGIQKDTTAAQLITKTLEKLNTTQDGLTSKVDSNFQFQKEVLGAAGIGNKLDISA